MYNTPLWGERVKFIKTVIEIKNVIKNYIFNVLNLISITVFINLTRSPQSGVLYIFKDRHFNIKKCVNNSKQVKVKSEWHTVKLDTKCSETPDDDPLGSKHVVKWKLN
jgi:hypothetical protein